MSTLSSAKKMGRPKVDSEAVNVRMERPLLDKLDAYRGEDSRPEAIRRLVEKGLRKAPLLSGEGA